MRVSLASLCHLAFAHVVGRSSVQIPKGVINIQDIYCLAPLQHGILFHHLMATEGDPYLLMIQLHFADKGVAESYADALQQIIQRYDILRTAFLWEGLSEPVQVIVLRNVPSLSTEIFFTFEKEVAPSISLTISIQPPTFFYNNLFSLIPLPTENSSTLAASLTNSHFTTYDHLLLSLTVSSPFPLRP